MKKFMMMLIVISLTVYISYKHSNRVYTYYLKMYYSRMYTENELLIKSTGLYDDKKYKKLENLLNSLMMIYPDNNDFKKLAAYNYMQMGDAVKGAELFTGVADNSIEESHSLEEILKSLYYNGDYGDLLYFYDKKIMRNNVNTAFYYGVSLYNKGRYDESYQSLIYSKNNTFMLPELYFYIGLNLVKKGKVEDALGFIKTAYEADRANQAYKKELIDVYRKAGFFKEAEVLLRSR